MANKETIQRAFVVLRSRYPNYFKTKEDLSYTMALWLNEFKNVPNETLLHAVNLICASCAYFPNTAQVADKIQRADWIASQKIATYLGRLETYTRYKNATQTQIDTWVDLQRVIDDSKGWTTKDFKNDVETFRIELNKAIRELPVEYRKENGIVEAEP